MLQTLVRFAVAGVVAVLAWLVLPYIIWALCALLCMSIGMAVGHIAASYVGAVPSVTMPSFAGLKARFTKGA